MNFAAMCMSGPMINRVDLPQVFPVRDDLAIRPQHKEVMAFIGNDERTTREIADKMRLDKDQNNSLMRQLQRRGLVVKRVTRDRGVVWSCP